MQTTIERNTRVSREHQRHEEFEFQRRIIDEITEASEKLAMVMRNPFEFELQDDGELYFKGGSVGDVLRKSVLVAEEIVITNPQFMVELIRRQIELQEYDEQRKLALGSDGDPDVLVVLSPIPDAVVAGTDLGAYDKERMKTLVRVYERTEGGILSTSMSLDRSDRRGLQAIAHQFGHAIHEDDGSEDILAMRFWGYSSVLGDPVKTVRRRYDEQLERTLGGEWYGGRQDGEVIDALSYIKSQPDIIQAHMERLKEIDNLSIFDKKPLYKEARYNFAAALDRRRYGASTFGDGGDLSGSGDAARSAGIEYSSDCPDGLISQDSSAESATNTLFGRTKKEFVSKVCPICGDKNVLTKIEGAIISGSCGCAKDICTNKQIRVNRRKGQHEPLLSNKELHPRESEEANTSMAPNEQEIKKMHGSNARIKLQISIGGACLVAYDVMTGRIIQKL